MSINTQDEMPLASVDDFLIEAGSLDKALLPLGFLLAFAFHHQLLSASFLRQREPQLSAVRLQDGQVSSLFAAHSRGRVWNRRFLGELSKAGEVDGPRPPGPAPWARFNGKPALG